MEAPDDDHHNDDDDTDGVESSVAEPVLDVTALASRSANTLVNCTVLTAVEESPNKVNADGDNDNGVDGDTVRVEANSTVLPRNHAEKTENMSEKVSAYSER